jgi:hypothetical protein
MNLFQWLTVSILALVLVGELLRRRQAGLYIGFWLFRCIVWVAVALAILDPNQIQRVASAIGIATGTNLVLYIFVFLFLGTSFYFYSRTVMLQREITQLTRHLAIQEARQGTAGERKE